MVLPRTTLVLSRADVPLVFHVPLLLQHVEGGAQGSDGRQRHLRFFSMIFSPFFFSVTHNVKHAAFQMSVRMIKNSSDPYIDMMKKTLMK